MPSSTLEPAHVPVPFSTLLRSAIRSMLVLLTYDNVLVWDSTAGKRNKQADVEGPYYILNPPSREIEKGKAIMAPTALLKQFRPFLMTVRVLTRNGDPIAGAELDWWQADTTGSYYLRTYTLRGRVKTDEEGYAEVVTVAPGPYGPEAVRRAAHFHVWIRAPGAQPGQTAYDDLTTQIYVCDANDAQLMKPDLVNYLRKIRLGNIAQCWSIPDKKVDEGRPYKDFPELSPSDERALERVEWWNTKLAEMTGAELRLKIVAGATKELHLNPKDGRY